MSTQEKATGRVKQAAGDLAGNERLRREGVEEERKADARRELHDAQRRAEQKRAEIEELEGQGGSPGGAQSSP